MSSRSATVFLALALIFITPALAFTPTTEQFELPKIILVYIIGGFLGLMFVTTTLPAKSIKLSVLDCLVILYVGATSIAFLFSNDNQTALWGDNFRFSGGLLSLVVFCLLYFFFKYSVKISQRTLLLTLIASAIPPCIIAYTQLSQTPQARSYGTFGQPNFFGTYLATVLLSNCYCLITPTQTTTRKYLLAGLLPLFLFFFWKTYSLGSIVGLTAGVITYALSTSRQLNPKKLGLAVLVLGFSFVVAGQTVVGLKFRDVVSDLTKVVQGSYGAKTTSTAKNNLSDPAFIRLYIWQGTLNMVLSAPKVVFFGVGPENFVDTFALYRPQQLNYSSEWSYIVTKPHNIYLEILAETGLLALLLYLAIIGYKLLTTPSAIVRSLIMCLCVAGFFGPSFVYHELLFWLLISF